MIGFGSAGAVWSSDITNLGEEPRVRRVNERWSEREKETDQRQGGGDRINNRTVFSRAHARTEIRPRKGSSESVSDLALFIDVPSREIASLPGRLTFHIPLQRLSYLRTAPS